MKRTYLLLLLIDPGYLWAVEYRAADDATRIEALVAAEIAAAKGPLPARNFTDLYERDTGVSRGLQADVGLKNKDRARLIRISEVADYVGRKVKITMTTKGAMVGTIDRVTERSVILKINRGHGWGQFSIAKDRIRQIETAK